MKTLSQSEAPISFLGRQWEMREIDEKALSALRDQGLHPLAANVLAGRNVRPEAVSAFLSPKIRDLLPDPLAFQDMARAARRLGDAIRSGEKIGIWSDYDADGATSAAILGSFLRMCGRGDFALRIPDRIEEGYGPNAPGLLEMQAQGCSLICVLDAGTTAFEPLEAAHQAGLDIIVADHHAAEAELPPAVAVVNPNRQDDTTGQGHLCAAGVTFLLTIATTAVLRQEGWFDGCENRPGATPDLWSLLDLVALGTVCDVVPLIGINRAFVFRGLTLLSERRRPGLRALALAAGIDPAAPITERECGWVLGPRINAGGRIGSSDSGALLLLEEDTARAVERAGALDALNAERKTLEKSATEAALAQFADRQPGVDRGLALAVVEDAHEGIVGISAARLREACDAPAIVLSRAHDGALKGSARSVPGFDIGHAIIAARQAGILVKGGGHGMAGGLTIREERLAEFIAFMDARIDETEYARRGVVTTMDADLPLGDLTVDALRGLEHLRPFGTANEEPRIVLSGATLAGIRVLKDTHLKMSLSDGNRQMDALMWGVAQMPLGQRIQACLGKQVDILGVGSVNEFRGNEAPQIIVSDLRLSAGQ